MRCRSAAKFAKEAEKSGVKPDFSSCAAKKNGKSGVKLKMFQLRGQKKRKKVV